MGNWRYLIYQNPVSRLVRNCLACGNKKRTKKNTLDVVYIPSVKRLGEKHNV